MIINEDAALYVYKVVTAISAGKLALPPGSDRCPECNDEIDPLSSGDHVVTMWSENRDGSSPEHLTVIIACEGYWCIDPNLVGIESKTWMGPDAELLVDDELIVPMWADVAPEDRPSR